MTWLILNQSELWKKTFYRPPLANWFKRRIRIRTDKSHLQASVNWRSFWELFLAKSWAIKIYHGKTRFKRVWNLLRQILDEGWTGQEHSNAPAPVLDRHRFKMGFHHITDIVSASVDTVDEKWNDLLPMNSFWLHRASANFLLKTCNHKIRWPGQGQIVHKSVWKKCSSG